MASSIHFERSRKQWHVPSITLLSMCYQHGVKISLASKVAMYIPNTWLLVRHETFCAKTGRFKLFKFFKKSQIFRNDTKSKMLSPTFSIRSTYTYNRGRVRLKFVERPLQGVWVLCRVDLRISSPLCW